MHRSTAKETVASTMVYSFGDGTAEGCADMRDLLGGKGANLAEMSNLKLPVPPGFTIVTQVCTSFYNDDRQYPDGLEAQVHAALDEVGKHVGRKFGDPNNPLLVSVRSGSRSSMPGMMDTVLNLGLNDETVEALARGPGGQRFAYDSYRRFIQMYSDVVLDMNHDLFEDVLAEFKNGNDYALDTELTAADCREIVAAYKRCVAAELGSPFPQNVYDQLWGAIGAVFDSWQNVRARTYRRLHGIAEDSGTAVNIQAMVFGNMGDDSATGVAFTRNPSNGGNEFYGEYLINAQGEDVVSGIRTPQSLTKKARLEAGSDRASMEEAMPGEFDELARVFRILETHYRDMQDVEFTVERGKLWVLQTRSGKRTAQAALKIAADMVREGLVTPNDALLKLDPAALDQLLHPALDPDAERHVVTKGLPASPGAASGQVVFTADEAESLSANGTKVVLVRTETSPEDIHGMHAAQAILTARGGMTSHAAVVARGMGRPCVSGAGAVRVDAVNSVFSVGGTEIKKGDVITVDGTTGEVILGEIPTVQPELSGDFACVMDWADEARRLGVRANAETPSDVKVARDFGAEGIGLCRTEHMFFDADRVAAVRDMILAERRQDRVAALERILPMQRRDFEDIFEIMSGDPVTVRLLDPPLHEFLPKTEDEIAAVARISGMDLDQVRRRSAQLHEFNPMLGHRGCRLGMTYPEIYEMQVRAILEAAFEVEVKTGIKAKLEIMVPLVAVERELDILRQNILEVAAEIEQEKNCKFDILIGTMIELPRAALQAGEIAHYAEFFSFGTNDLTQTVFGISRDDSSRFLSQYVRQGILAHDPFVSLDQTGVGELIGLAAERGRRARPDIKLGICGEHGGDPASVEFCHAAGLDYVSCSPYRVPIARLAAAQAALRREPV